MSSIFIIFPHHLFEDLAVLRKANAVYLVEEDLYFNQYKFHRQKLVFHRASMKIYQSVLEAAGITVHYIEAADERSRISQLIRLLKNNSVEQISVYDPCDEWLEKRITKACDTLNFSLHIHESPLYINSRADLHPYFEKKERYFLADFYMQERKRFRILVDKAGKPAGGKWSHDEENRLKYPKGKLPPEVIFPGRNEVYEEAVKYTEEHFPQNYGSVSDTFIFPYSHAQAKDWLHDFFETRFRDFGAYEDAIIGREHILHHSVLTPMLNTGLLTPKQVINEAIRYARENDIPLNSLEGFIRQIIGWREFIRAVYIFKGSEQRTINHWKFSRKIPASFYNGSTGIVPVDETIKKVLATGYCHHIERLMILGNFMLLCEFDPDEVYRWFMEMFIDAYDWVMVPNVYGMSQFADGGLMATKPYISASSYILKMSNYKKGDWCEIWDALFWSFMNRHRDFFMTNPRLGMLVKNYDKMEEGKRTGFENTAAAWLKDIDKSN